MGPRWAFEHHRAPHAALWTVWTAVSGYAMGACVLDALLFPSFVTAPASTLAFIALAPASLSGLVAALALRARRKRSVGLSTLGIAIAAGGLCAPLTHQILHLAGARLSLDAIAVSCFGGIFVGMPLGALFGVAYGSVLALAHRMRVRGSCADLDAALLAAGLSWMIIGTVCAVMPAIGEHANFATQLCWWLALVGACLATAGVVRWELRHRALCRVRDGHVPGMSIEELPAGPLPAPPLFPVGAPDAMIVTRDALGGPFRDRPRPLVCIKRP